MQVISGVNNSAFFAQSAYSASTASYDVNGYPITSYVPESGIGYNSQAEINSINGSAISTVDTERQFFTHDSTLTHLSNSAQYALGVNMSAISADLARMMGVDETVLWSGSAYMGAFTANLSEPATAFKTICFVSKPHPNNMWQDKLYFDTTLVTDNNHQGSITIFGHAGGGGVRINNAQFNMSGNSKTIYFNESRQFNIITNSVTTASVSGYITKIVGIGRRQ